LLLSFTYVSHNRLLHGLGLLFLQISFWCIYEIGYLENDLIGDKFEEKAILSTNYKPEEYSISWWQAWLWSLILAVAGIFALNQSQNMVDFSKILKIFNDHSYNLSRIPQQLFYWILFLLIVRAFFWVYNLINKQTRVWFYLLLQTFRYCGFLAVVSTNIIGLMLLISNIVTRSIQYILYRYLGGQKSSWPMEFPRYFFCFLIYILLLAVLAANARDLSLLINQQVFWITIFCIARGSKHFRKVFSQFIPVTKDGSNQVV
jgi:hypothetical protein